jgi:hypothetical protein
MTLDRQLTECTEPGSEAESPAMMLAEQLRAKGVVVCVVEGAGGTDWNAEYAEEVGTLTALVGCMRAALSALTDTLTALLCVPAGWSEYEAAIKAAPVTSAKLRRVGNHDMVLVWFEGALSGEMILPSGCGDVFCTALGLKRVKDSQP